MAGKAGKTRKRGRPSGRRPSGAGGRAATPRPRGRLRRIVVPAVVIAAVAAVVYIGYLSLTVSVEFDRRRWDMPAQIYAAPLELYAGRRLSEDQLARELERLGYRASAGALAVGEFRRASGAIEISIRPFAHADGVEPARVVDVGFDSGRIESLGDASGAALPYVLLDPLLIGSVFPAHGEDRIVVAPDAIPETLRRALIAVEDRRFEDHAGVDPRAIVRAAVANVASGRIEQGASTLTQQLVRSFFLSNEQTFSRKLNEALMAIALELRYSKDELMQAYVNEVYLGQDGARAIHGFGLASRFYFGKPLTELGVHEIALLVAIVRGPSYYDPRRQPERARERRDLVLGIMLEQGVVDAAESRLAQSRPLGIATQADRQSSYYAAFLDLLRRQLRGEYAASELERKGIRVFSTLDPTVQAAAEAALVGELERLQPGRPELEGALVVTSPQNAEVRALVGGRHTGQGGFNRALDAARPVGSLIKPAVYLAAIESGRHSLASLVDDAPIDVPLDDGSVWSPANFDGESRGTVSAVRALAESLNQATVRLGLDVGVDAVADTLVRLGLDAPPAPYPSLLLGALELSPIEVARIYNTLANGGFRAPLRSVRAVVDAGGATLDRYALAIRDAAEPADVYALNRALVEVMRRGTGRSPAAMLDAALVTAGKSGTSDGFRDSWFAGFTNDALVVAWVGNDENRPIGLTGSTGAGRVWARTVAALDTAAYAVPAPGAEALVWIDYVTGLATDADCPGAVVTAMPKSLWPPEAVACGSEEARGRSKVRQWLRRVLD